MASSSELTAFRRAIARSYPRADRETWQYEAISDGRESMGIGFPDCHAITLSGAADDPADGPSQPAIVHSDGAGMATTAQTGAWWSYMLRESQQMRRAAVIRALDAAVDAYLALEGL